MILEQLYLGCLSHASYLIGDEATGVAAVVDPKRDVDGYLDLAAQHGLRIEHVLLTHFHADYVAGHLELRERTGATIWLGAAADAEFDWQPLADDQVLEFGSVKIRALATPGHTPESTCYVVSDGDQPPHAVLTGDTLFVGDVGRPDLMASVGVTSEELAAAMYDSLHQKLLTLPDDTIVYPGHGAGSLCGKSLGSENHSTIGAQRASNEMLQPMAQADFVAKLTADQPAAPAYFGFDAQLNRSERITLDTVMENGLSKLSIDEVLSAMQDGALALDVRTADAFAAGHLAGSINVGLEGRFASWVGATIPPGAKLVLIAEPGTEREAITRLGRIGYDEIAGYLDGGPAAIPATHRTERIRWDQLRARMAQDPQLGVLDVRQPGEFASGHHPDSVHIPLGQLRDRLETLDRTRPWAAVCRSGYRSAVAASMLRAAGFENVVDIAGGIPDEAMSITAG